MDEGEWYFDKFRKYTIDLGRYEGAFFYAKEQVSDVDGKTSSTTTMTGVAKEFIFPYDVISNLYEKYNDVIFQKITSQDEFQNIIQRKSHKEKLSEKKNKKVILYKILSELKHTLPKENQDMWIKDICLECGFSTVNIGKKTNGSSSSSRKVWKTLAEINEIFGKGKKKSK